MYGIFTYIWLKFMVNVGKLPYMDPMGIYIYRLPVIQVLSPNLNRSVFSKVVTWQPCCRGTMDAPLIEQ